MFRNFFTLKRLVDQDLKNTMIANLEELLTGDTGKIEFEGEIKTRKEVFDILVERASITEEEKQRLEEKTKIKEKKETERAKFNFEDQLDSLLENSNIPEEIKKRLREIRKQ